MRVEPWHYRLIRMPKGRPEVVIYDAWVENDLAARAVFDMLLNPEWTLRSAGPMGIEFEGTNDTLRATLAQRV